MARAIWKGAISFGLVNIPIELHTAVRDTRPHFRMGCFQTAIFEASNFLLRNSVKSEYRARASIGGRR